MCFFLPVLPASDANLRRCIACRYGPPHVELVSRGQYAQMSRKRRQSLPVMPSYVRMITTGSPFAKENYMTLLKVPTPSTLHRFLHVMSLLKVPTPSTLHRFLHVKVRIAHETRTSPRTCTHAPVKILSRRRKTSTIPCNAWSTPSPRRCSLQRLWQPSRPPFPPAWCNTYTDPYWRLTS